ncbi:MAG: hypothetical protein IIX45_04605 [Lachnospiraceae bacterium]|nr:hypothetical protein [Lachnospiraceae bacterium]
MSFLDKLEKKFGRFAIKNLTAYILIAYAIGYLTYLVNPELYGYLVMNPQLIFKGQIWRLFTWICTMPQSLDLFIIFMFMFFLWVGTTLEKYWGTFKYNIFIFSGMVFMSLGAVLIYLVTYFVGPSSEFGTGIVVNISTYYINLTSFLAFAVLFGETTIYWMGILPIKVKWLAVLDLLLILYDFISMGKVIEAYETIYGEGNVSYISEYIWCCRITIILSLMNFIIFYFLIKKGRKLSPQAKQTRKEFKRDVSKIRPVSSIHRCEICGRTSETDENLVFRYCSKCKGNHEYCNEHLFTHEHIQ